MCFVLDHNHSQQQKCLNYLDLQRKKKHLIQLFFLTSLLKCVCVLMFTRGILYYFENDFLWYVIESLGIYSTIYNRILWNTQQILKQPQRHTTCRKGQNLTGFSLNLKRQTTSTWHCYVLAQCNSSCAENSKIKGIFDTGYKRAILLFCFVSFAGQGQRQNSVHSLVRHA